MLLALAVSAAIVLTGPLLLFNPWFVSFEQARSGVPERLGTAQAEVDRVTGAILCDLLLGCGDFTEGLSGSAPLMTDDERSHMRDVARLVRALWLALLVAVGLAVALLIVLRRERGRIGRILLWSGGLTGTLAVAVGAFFALAFDQAFLLFHEVFFPQGNFLFGADSNLLRLFPEELWFESSLVAGLLIVLSALVVILVGRRLAQH